MVTACCILQMSLFVSVGRGQEQITASGPVAKELKGGQADVYRISLLNGQFLNLVVMQQGIDVRVRLFAPGGKELCDVDSPNGADGPEPVFWIASQTGDYRLEISSEDAAVPQGHYQIKVEAWRMASKADREYVAQQLQLREAVQLDIKVNQLYSQSDYEAALKLAQQSLAIRQRLLPSADPLIAQSMFNLAGVHLTLGNYSSAEPLLRQSLEIREKKLDPDDLELAKSLNSLAGLYQAIGDYERAEPLFKRALQVREKKLGLENRTVAQTIKNLGLLYKDKRDYKNAEQLLVRARDLLIKLIGSDDHPIVATTLNSLAVVYQEQGELDKAEPLYQRALQIQEKAFGPDNLDVANTIHNLAVLYLLKHDYARAEPLYKRGLETIEKNLGSEHPLVANALESISVLYQVTGRVNAAIQCQRRSSEIREHDLAVTIATGSENQKRLYMSTLDIETDMAISLHVLSAPQNSDAASLALTAILRRKGRVLDAMANSIETLRNRSTAKDRELLERLFEIRSKLATAVINGPGTTSAAEYKNTLTKLRTDADELEAAISARSAQFRVQSAPVTLEAIQRSLPHDSALVEISTYHPFDPLAVTKEGALGKTRYVAYVLKRTGGPAWVELGEGATIDKKIAALRRLLADPSSQIRESARALDEQIMRPVRHLTGPIQNLFVSADGALNLIPFGALIDEQNHYLVENYTLTYLTSGRDLLRLQSKSGNSRNPVVIANPTFDGNNIASDKSATTSNRSGLQRRSDDLAQAVYGQLPGAAVEGQALKRILPNATLLTGPRATELAVKRLKSPLVLHIATHGFFLPNESNSGNVQSESASHWENPLLRSGIVLAGANQRRGGSGEDGILTALEAAGLDLWGTRVVVLSACETGLGEVRNGDGVYGLRRALVLAGAESQLMTLWKVDDSTTKDLMVNYYKLLEAHEGRADALRHVQLRMLHSKQVSQSRGGRGTQVVTEDANVSRQGRTHPYYWASFIQSGDWRPLLR